MSEGKASGFGEADEQTYASAIVTPAGPRINVNVLRGIGYIWNAEGACVRRPTSLTACVYFTVATEFLDLIPPRRYGKSQPPAACNQGVCIVHFPAEPLAQFPAHVCASRMG
jgi:hypothetical protein